MSGLILVVLAVAAFVVFAPVTLPGGLSLSLGNRADAMLRKLAPDDTFWRQTGALKTSPRDGPAPEMAGQSYVLEVPADALRGALDRACRDHDLAPPQTPRREGDSDLICTGQQGGGQVDVFLFLKCEQPGCAAGLWIHAY